MGMGYGANFALTISEENVHRIIKEPFEQLMDVLKKWEVDFGAFAQCIRNDWDLQEELDPMSQDVEEEIMDTFEAFRKAFQEKTHMNIYLNYHSSEDHGDRYDTIDGGFFELNFSEVFEHTPNARKLVEIMKVPIDIEYFVTFG